MVFAIGQTYQAGQVFTDILTFLGDLVSKMSTLIDVFPNIYKPIAIIFLTIAVVYLIVGRNA